MSLCPFGIVRIGRVFWGGKKNPSQLLVSFSFSSSFLSAFFFPSIVTAIPMVDGHIFGVQNTLSIHLQIATKSNSDSCTSRRAILYHFLLDTHYFSLPHFNRRSLIASSFLFHKAFFNLFSPRSFQGHGYLSGACRSALVTLLAAFARGFPRLRWKKREWAGWCVNFLSLE